MKLKSYFAATVEVAMAMARKELGEDALLVNARPTTAETRSLGAMEVVFGVPPTSAAPKSAMTYAPPLSLESVARVDEIKTETPSESANTIQTALANYSRPNGSPTNAAGSEVAGLRREVERMAEALRMLSFGNTALQVKHPLVYTRLLEAELDAELAQIVADGTPLEELFSVDATLGRAHSQRKNQRSIVMVVGPPGAGKTTTLVKLAARYGLATRRPAHIISTDVYRIAAADQLRVLASILGLGCTVVETALALEQVLEEHRNKELIFIDTPGLTRAEMVDASDLARLASTHPEFDTHLVLPASMKPADMGRAIMQYEVFAPGKLLFTRLDETAHFGPLVNESARRGKPISFLSAGQQIPDHLEPATKQILTTLVLGRRVQPAPEPPRPAIAKTSPLKSRAQGAGA